METTTELLTRERSYRLRMLAVVLALTVIVLDQALKIWVKTSFYLGESLHITDWFQLVFIENNGMAFGMEIGSKLMLTLFRIVVVAAVIWYTLRLLTPGGRQVRTGYVVCLALVIAGAAGNIFDCMFYGVLFNNPMPPEVAVMFPPDGGYAPLLHGKVVDMFYFPLFSFYWPDWVPMVGGQYFLFFQPIFNLADAAISVGMILLLLFYSHSMVWPAKPQAQEPEADA